MRKIAIILLSILSFHLIAYAQDNVLWKFKTNDRVYSSPLIDESMVYFGSGDNSFYALDKNSGEKIWQYKTKGAVHSSPTLYENLVYFGSADGALYA